MELDVLTNKASSGGVVDSPSDSRNEVAVADEPEMESENVYSLKPSSVDDSTPTTIVGDIESSSLDFGQNDNVNENDIESSTFRDIAETESDGDPAENSDEEEPVTEEETIESLTCPCRLKPIIGLIFFTIIFLVVIDAAFGKNYVRQNITALLEWIRENPREGVITFIAVYFVATLICVPGALLTIGAGFVFSATNDGSLVIGVALGTLAVFVGASTSAVVAFLLARYLMYDQVRRLSQKYSIFEALDIALSEKGFRIMCLLRMSPITPFFLLNYVAGVTTVTLTNYVLSIFCILPGAVLYVFVGASARSLTDSSENKTVTIIAVTFGVVFGVLGIALTSHYARKELNKEVDLVRSRLYNRTTSRRNRVKYRRNVLRRQRGRYRRRIDRKRAGRRST